MNNMERNQSKITPPTGEIYPQILDTECYGNLWNPKNVTCISCPALNACGSRQLYKTHEVIKQVEGDTPFLSRASVYNIDMDHLGDCLRCCKPSPIEDLYAVIRRHTRLTDLDTIKGIANNLITKHNLEHTD